MMRTKISSPPAAKSFVALRRWGNFCRLTAPLLLTLVFAGSGWAESGERCPPLTLSQSLDTLKSRLEALVPVKSLVIGAETCVAGLHIVAANYSSVCELAPSANASLIVGLGQPSPAALSQLMILVPYSPVSAARIRAAILDEGGRRAEESPAFLGVHLANAEESELYLTGGGASLLLLTKERGPAALNDRDFSVVRLFAHDTHEDFLSRVRTCASR